MVSVNCSSFGVVLWMMFGIGMCVKDVGSMLKCVGIRLWNR